MITGLGVADFTLVDDLAHATNRQEKPPSSIISRVLPLHTVRCESYSFGVLSGTTSALRFARLPLAHAFWEESVNGLSADAFAKATTSTRCSILA